jgi:hypothetical protein
MAMLRTENFDAMAFTSRAFKNGLCHKPSVNSRLNNRLKWPTTLVNIHDAAIGKYREGARGHENFFTSEEIAFLASIGCSPQELYILVADWCELWESLHGCED